MIHTYFVKNGWLNGEVGIFAKTAGFGEQQPDGWYYLPEGDDDGVGPFKTQTGAQEAAAEIC